jgi:hypothetical protein
MGMEPIWIARSFGATNLHAGWPPAIGSSLIFVVLLDEKPAAVWMHALAAPIGDGIPMLFDPHPLPYLASSPGRVPDSSRLQHASPTAAAPSSASSGGGDDGHGSTPASTSCQPHRHRPTRIAIVIELDDAYDPVSCKARQGSGCSSAASLLITVRRQCFVSCVIRKDMRAFWTISR